EYLAYCVKTVREACSEELKRLGQDLDLLSLPLTRIKYSEAVNLLRKSGEEIEYGMDFSKTQEKKLAGLVGKKAFFMVDWPLELKAFYAMPNPDGKSCRAFDLIYNGPELSSGTLRIHLPTLLISRLLLPFTVTKPVTSHEISKAIESRDTRARNWARF